MNDNATTGCLAVGGALFVLAIVLGSIVAQVWFMRADFRNLDDRVERLEAR